MPFKTDLQEIFSHSQQLLDSNLSAQQRSFITYMASTTRQLLAQIAPLPQTKDAYEQVIPTLGESLNQRLAVIYGYARLLIDQPQRFGSVDLHSKQVSHLERIYQLGLGLAQLAREFRDQSQHETARQRQAPAEVVDLGELLRLEEPLWRYWLRHTHIHLHIVGADEGLLVMNNRCHLRQLLRHITLTMAQELIVQGSIALHVDKGKREVAVVYHSSELEWTANALSTLFLRQGRDVYTAYLTRYGGSWRVGRWGKGQADVLIISLIAAS